MLTVLHLCPTLVLSLWWVVLCLLSTERVLTEWEAALEEPAKLGVRHARQHQGSSDQV